MAVNKVIYGQSTLVDLTDTTAEASDVVSGKYFYGADGVKTAGTMEPIHMTILSYGHSTWSDFITAYNTNTIVYCRASTGSNPASGSQTRLAFMAYVNNATNPTNVEFQYYRSVNAHSDSQQGDQTYVYKLDKTSGWSVTVRENYSKIVVGTGLAKSYANSTITLSVTNGLPAVTSSDNGKVLTVVDGAWVSTNKSANIVTVYATVSSATPRTQLYYDSNHTETFLSHFEYDYAVAANYLQSADFIRVVDGADTYYPTRLEWDTVDDSLEITVIVSKNTSLDTIMVPIVLYA